MIILGLNAYHADAAACIVSEGRLIAAAEEERFRRVKHWAGFPSRAIAYCLTEANLKLSDVTHVAINRSNRTNLLRKIAYVVRNRPHPSLILDRLRNRARWGGVGDELARAFPHERFAGTVEYVEHHLAHLASAYFASNYDEAAAVSVDGFGDFASAAWGRGEGTSLSVEKRILFPHSLGILYQAMTQYLGFPHYGDEYKVMGLAAYGKPSRVADVSRLVMLDDRGGYSLNLTYFRFHKEQDSYEWEGGEPTFGPLYSDALERLLGPQRSPSDPLTDDHRDLAFATQSVFEQALFNVLEAVQRQYGTDRLVLAGGCAYNSVANGKIRNRTAFRQLYLQSAAGDAGGAIGAAYAVWHQLGGARMGRMSHAYWGPSFKDHDVSLLLSARNDEIVAQGCSIRRCDVEHDLLQITAAAIADGLVVGWFQGRMEWGPRALGNRSILGDPRRSDMKNILNLKIKRRESFRPFAPSVLREAVPDWFEQDDDVPFMLQVFPIKPERRATIPAVSHVDGTGRLQTVSLDSNPRYYRLIERFRDLTGVPMVLNTSFNESEPVVCRPEEALDCFLRTKMDLLVMENYVISRDSQESSPSTFVSS